MSTTTYSHDVPLSRTSAHPARRPLFSGLDIAGFVAATIMALGPLTAFTAGL
jgi:hypothetical protein